MPTINPKPILDMNYAFAQTAMLMAAVRLHIFTYLASDPLIVVALATLVEAEPDAITRLLIFIFQKFSAWLSDSSFQEVHRLDVAGPSPIIVAQKGENRL